jgi:hypothetical protein
MKTPKTNKNTLKEQKKTKKKLKQSKIKKFPWNENEKVEKQQKVEEPTHISPCKRNPKIYRENPEITL